MFNVGRTYYNNAADVLRNDASLTAALNLALIKVPIVSPIDFDLSVAGIEADFSGYAQLAIAAAVRPKVFDNNNGGWRFRFPHTAALGFFKVATAGTLLQQIYGMVLVAGVNGDPLNAQTLVAIQRFPVPVNMTYKGALIIPEIPEIPFDLKLLV